MGREISREDIWPKPSRWNAEKRYQIVKEALSQKEPLAKTAKHIGLTIPPKVRTSDASQRTSSRPS